ncbi:hypothetical protein D3C76_1464790 [compost metagenome]
MHHRYDAGAILAGEPGALLDPFQGGGRNLPVRLREADELVQIVLACVEHQQPKIGRGLDQIA